MGCFIIHVKEAKVDELIAHDVILTNILAQDLEFEKSIASQSQSVPSK